MRSFFASFGTQPTYTTVPREENKDSNSNGVALAHTPGPQTAPLPPSVKIPIAIDALSHSLKATKPTNTLPSAKKISANPTSNLDEKPKFSSKDKIYYGIEIGTLRPRIAINNKFLAIADEKLYENEFEYNFEDNFGDAKNSLFYFAYKVLPEIHELIENFSPTRKILKDIPLSKPTFIKIEKLNLEIKKIILILEFLEIQHGLKTNFFAHTDFFDDQSIDSIIKDFYLWINGLGYEFDEKNSYPYYAERLEQLNRLDTESEVPLFKQRITTHRKTLEILAQKHNQEIAQEQKETQSTIANKKSKKIIRLIEQRITTLKAEKIRWVARSKAKAKRIEDLSEIKKQLAGKRPLEEVLDTVLLHPHLVEGSASPILKQMRLTASTNLDRISLINCEIEKLEKKQNAFLSNKIKLEKRILALKNLKDLLNQPGYLLDEALSILKKEQPENYKILLAYEKKLLAKITAIDQAISDKITEIEFDRQQKFSEQYAHLQGITNIHEIDKLDNIEPLCIVTRFAGANFEEQSISNLTDDSYPIEAIKIKNIQPTVTFENLSGAILGKKLINYQQQENMAAQIRQQNDNVIRTINTHIESLESSRRRCNCFFNRTLDKKLYLLEKLMQKLETLSLRDALTNMLNDPQFSKNYWLLRQGKTGEMLKSIEAADSTHIDLIQKVALRILHLKKIQTKNPGFFTPKAPELAGRISALEILQQQLQDASKIENPEGRFQAIYRLSAREKTLLRTHDNAIYSQIDNWEVINHPEHKSAL